jgi:hypothetical protein
MRVVDIEKETGIRKNAIWRMTKHLKIPICHPLYKTNCIG